MIQGHPKPAYDPEPIVKPSHCLLTSLLLLTLAAPALADTPRPMVPEDYYQFRFVSDPRISPDGERVALVQAQVSEDRRSRESAIWMVPVDGSRPPRRFTSGTGDRMPRFSPDGTRLALLRSEDGQVQVFVMPVDGGEALAVTRLRQGSISSMDWLSDEAMLLTLNIDPAVEDPTIAAEEDQEPTPDVRVFSRQLYMSEAAGFLDERHLISRMAQ